jgi:hypothetical protein
MIKAVISLLAGVLMSNEKCVLHCHWDWQAQNFSNELTTGGIKNIVRPIPREYSSIVTGVTDITCGVFVEEKDFSRALDFVKKHEEALKLSSGPNEALEKNNFRNTVMFSLLGVVFIPVLFNIISIFSYRKLLQQNVSSSKKNFALFAVILCWALSITLIYLFLK